MYQPMEREPTSPGEILDQVPDWASGLGRIAG
jgi:hypothetical protein